MIFFKNRSIGFKIIVLSAVLAAIFLGVSFGYALIGMRSELIESTLTLAKAHTVDEKDKLELIDKDIQNTLVALSITPPLQGMIRAQGGGGFDTVENSTYDQWRNRLAVIFTAEIQSRDLYSQLRYIDENGQEIVRVDDLGDVIYRYPDDKLQNKGTRSYFIEAMNSSDIYVSNIELNREGNPPVISYPVTPVIRYAVPIFDEVSGDKKGIIVANIFFDKMISQGSLASSSTGNVYLLDKNGYYLSHPDDSKMWGSSADLNNGENFSIDFPDVWENIKANVQGIIEQEDSIFVFTKIFSGTYKDAREWIIIQNIERSTLFAPVDAIVTNSSLIGFVVYIMLFFVFLLVVRRLLKPLNELSLSAEQIGKGDFSVHVPIESNDEIGRVAKAFNLMVKQLQGVYASLEDQVKSKTKDLSDKIKELASVSDRLSIATKSAKIGIWDWNVKKDILSWDDQMYKLYGINKKDFGKAYEAWEKGLHPDDLARSNKEIRLALDGKRTFDTSFRVVWPDKSVHDIRAFAIVKRDKSGKAVRMIGVNWDITSEKNIDRVKTEFVSLASHQLKTPLTSIKWYAEMFKNEDIGKLNPQQKEFIEEIYQGNERMIRLINSLLNVSRLEMGTFAVNPEPINCVEIADTVLDELKSEINKKKITATKDYKKDLPLIKADGNLLRIILQNLVSNAIKYSPSKSTIIISLKRDDADLLISVADSGYGIPKKQQNKIFNKLFRADNIVDKGVEGNGLGLYIVKSIIQVIGGEISFKSEENKGTQFYVKIPLSDMKQEMGAAQN